MKRRLAISAIWVVAALLAVTLWVLSSEWKAHELRAATAQGAIMCRTAQAAQRCPGARDRSSDPHLVDLKCVDAVDFVYVESTRTIGGFRVCCYGDVAPNAQPCGCTSIDPRRSCSEELASEVR